MKLDNEVFIEEKKVEIKEKEPSKSTKPLTKSKLKFNIGGGVVTGGSNGAKRA